MLEESSDTAGKECSAIEAALSSLREQAKSKQQEVKSLCSLSSHFNMVLTQNDIELDTQVKKGLAEGDYPSWEEGLRVATAELASLEKYARANYSKRPLTIPQQGISARRRLVGHMEQLSAIRQVE